MEGQSRRQRGMSRCRVHLPRRRTGPGQSVTPPALHHNSHVSANCDSGAWILVQGVVPGAADLKSDTG